MCVPRHGVKHIFILACLQNSRSKKSASGVIDAWNTRNFTSWKFFSVDMVRITLRINLVMGLLVSLCVNGDAEWRCEAFHLGRLLERFTSNPGLVTRNIGAYSLSIKKERLGLNRSIIHGVNLSMPVNLIPRHNYSMWLLIAWSHWKSEARSWSHQNHWKPVEVNLSQSASLEFTRKWLEVICSHLKIVFLSWFNRLTWGFVE